MAPSAEAQRLEEARLPVLIVPGLRDHVEDHWQTLLAGRLSNCRIVAPGGRDKLDLGARLAQIEAAAAEFASPPVIVAHSAGVIMTVHWARRTRLTIRGALLAAPPDLETPMPAGYPTMEALGAAGWLPTPRGRLPFPSLVAASRNDPLARFERVAELAEAWGSRFVDLGEVGHLNHASGYGDWPLADALIASLAATA